MQISWHGNQIPAVVRGKRLHRHRALVAEGRGTAVVLIAQGPPRAWERSLEAAVRGVSGAIEERAGAEEILVAAAREVRARADSLVDDKAVQVHAAVITVADDGAAEVTSAGSCRVYLDRKGEHRRLSSKAATKGLSDSITFSTTKERLKPGDVVIVGPSHLFSVTGVAMLARLLHQEGKVSARRVVRGLLSLCRSQETGGAAVTLKVE